MPISKNAYRRFILLDRELRKQRFPGRKKIAEICDVSEEQIKKDIELLRLDPWNAPIAFDSKKKGYYYSEQTFMLPAFFISESQLDTLKMLGTVLKPFNQSNVYKNYKKLLNSIVEFLKPEQAAYLEKEQHSIYVQKIYGADERLIEIYQAIETQNEISFEYTTDWSKETAIRTVQPYAIKLYNNNWFLVAFDVQRKEHRTFFISKLKKLQTLNSVFVKKKDFDVNKYYADVFGIMRIPNKKPEKLVLEIEESSFYRLEQIFDKKITSKSPIENEKILVELLLQLNDEVLGQLYSFSTEVKITAPKWFVEQYIGKMEAIRRLYS